MNTIQDKVEMMYNNLVNMPSDINEHMPTLKRYAEECETVTEMGVRWVVSTYALAIAKPKCLISIDIRHPGEEEWDSRHNSGQRLNDIIEYCAKNNINYSFILGDTTALTIQETDMLFIDTSHVYEQLKAELKLHGNKAKKYLVFHDTELFRFRNENNPNISGKDENDKIGLWPAIHEFLIENPHWKIHEVFKNCNGLTVLKRN